MRHLGIFEKFLRAFQRNQLLQCGEKVLVAISGGADSVALLHLFREIQPQYSLGLELAHFNHGWRGKESDEDEEFVRQLALQYGMEIQVERTAPIVPPSRRQNLEEAAREARYHFLIRAAQKARAQKVALGHTRNDQAETLLMRLIRGSGTTGLAGIPPFRPPFFIRPLLGINREEIAHYLAKQHLPWREDSSNVLQRHLRNRIRHHLLPLLSEEYNPRILDRLAETAGLLREEREALEQLARNFLAEHSRQHPLSLELAVDPMGKLPPGLRGHVLRQALWTLGLNPAMLSADQTSRVLELLQPGKSGKSFSKGGLRIFRQFQHLLLEKGGKATSITTGYRYHLPIPGECHILEAGVTVRAAFTTADIDNNRVSTLFLDRAILHEGMEIRNWQPGDAYCPQGRSANIKIKELLQQAKVSRPLRAAWPVYLIEQRIIKAMSFLPEATVSLQEGNSACCCVYLEEIPSNYPSHSLITEE